MCLHPRKILPIPLWARVFSFVESPQDLYNLIHASPYFAEILEHRLPNIQIQLAFPHLANLIGKKNTKKKCMSKGSPYLSIEDLLNCRLVCKSWDEAVKSYFQGGIRPQTPFIDDKNLTQNHFYGSGLYLRDKQFSRWEIAFSPDTLQHYELVMEEEFDEMEKVDKIDVLLMEVWRKLDEADQKRLQEKLRERGEEILMEELRAMQGLDKIEGPDGYYKQWFQSIMISHPPDTEANPFLSRNWSCELRLDNVAGQRYLENLEILRTYGRHLETFYLSTDRSLVPLRCLYAILVDWLHLTPNVTNLSVFCDEAEYWRGLPPPLGQVPALNNFIQTYPLPDLPKLRSLSLFCCSPQIQLALLERFHHIETLVLEPSLLNWGLDEAFQPAPLENLRRLTLTIRSEADLNVVGRCHHPSWNQLRSLQVDFSFEHRYPVPRFGQNWDLLRLDAFAPTWERIISWLNHYFSDGSTLTKVFLALPRYRGDGKETALQDTQRCRLQLRHVQELKLRLMNSAILMDFLLPMKDSLQKMAIEFMPERARAGDYSPNARVGLLEEIQWNGYLGKKLLESNLWATFPKLDFLRIESYQGWTYRRRRGTPVFINPDGTEEEVSAEHEGEQEAE